MNNKLMKVLALGGAVVALTAGAAFAESASVSSSVNVRSGPGLGYSVIDQLGRGDTVDVNGRQGSWCHVAKAGPDGWVACNYLAAYRGSDYYDDDDYYAPEPRVQLQFGFGTGYGGGYPSHNQHSGNNHHNNNNHNNNHGNDHHGNGGNDHDNGDDEGYWTYPDSND